MTQKFEDVLFVIQTGTEAAAIATASSNPVLAGALAAANRLIKIGLDLYDSGRERGEWTEAEQLHFDTVVRPGVTSQPHWIKQPPAVGE